MTRRFDDILDEVTLGLNTLFGPWSEHIETRDWIFEGPVNLIRARTTNGSIVVRGWDQDRVSVEASKTVRGPTEGLAQALAARVRIFVEQGGKGVYLRTLHPHPPLGSVFFVHYTIDVPRRADVALSTRYGGITATGLEGAIEAKTRNGHIQLRETLGPASLYTASGRVRIIDTDGTVDAESGKGNIEVENASGRGQLRTTSGDIVICGSEGTIEARSRDGDLMLSDGRGGTEMETVKGDIQACLAHLDSASRFTTGAGSIHLDLAAINGSVDIRTDAGAVELWLPDGFAGELNAATDQGDIDCKLPITPTLQTNTLLRGRLGTGEGPLVRAQARYGSIHIRSRTS